MDFDSLVGALKVVGAAISGVLGVAGLIFDFKHEGGKLTRAGKLVLTGIIASGLVAVAASSVEIYKAKSESAKQLARTEQLLHELSRAVQPISKLEAGYWVEVRSGNSTIDAYLKRLDREIESRIEQLRKIEIGKDIGLQAISAEWNGNPLTVEISNNSDLWPKDQEAFIALAALTYGYTVFILKEPIEIQKFTGVHGTGDFSAFGVLTKDGKLNWDRREKKLYIRSNMVYEKALWNSNGRVTSVVDLMGAQLVLIPPNAVQLPTQYAQFRNKELEELQQEAHLKTIVFTVADGRDIWLSGKSFKESKMPDGRTVLSLVLPTDETSFRRFTSSAEGQEKE
ncbi:hypothetical protein [Bradyrhizobium oligotrophicum]|uniref:hypothetical protein n=1 Tax=Bradyrhizobium oligotrophicum TaxID=44255 RepID=UPI003EBEB2FE